MNFEEVMLKNAKGKPVNYNLSEIKITNDKDLTSLAGIEKFTKLETLELNAVPNLKNVTGLPDSLKNLICGNSRIGTAARFADIHTIDKFPEQIEKIDLGNNIHLKEIPEVPNTCKILVLFNTKVSEFSGGEGLEELNITMTNFSKFEDASTKYTKLRELNIGDTYISSLTNLPPLIRLTAGYSGKKRLESLKYVDLSNQEDCDTRFYLYSAADGMVVKWEPDVEINFGDWMPRNGLFFGKTTSEIFIKKNLNKQSEKRGAASIMDTGLFDFIQ